MYSFIGTPKIKFNSDLSYLICVEDEAIKKVFDRLETLNHISGNIRILHLGKAKNLEENWCIQQFNSIESLKSKLIKIFGRAYMGMRFYAVGSEQFVWDLSNCARSCGLAEAEISLEIVPSQVRNIYCSNCQTINRLVRNNILTCSSCAIKLEVLNHFSPLKNAYLGIYADVESPEKLPEVEFI